MSSDIAEHAERTADYLGPITWENQAEMAWIRWRAERAVPPDYEQLLRVAFHAGFNRGWFAR